MESIERFESDLLHVAGKKDNIGRAVGEGLADRRVQARRIRMGATREVVGRNAAARARSSAPDSWLLLITCPTCSVVPSRDARTAILTWSRSLLYPPNAGISRGRRPPAACRSYAD